jgi:hypothetical protein
MNTKNSNHAFRFPLLSCFKVIKYQNTDKQCSLELLKDLITTKDQIVFVPKERYTQI